MIRNLLYLFAAVLLSSAGSARGQSAARHVLLICVDDLRPTLGCYDDAVAITPAIDQLAARGVRFGNAHCQWPVCGPSRASMMTSLRPEAVGVMDLKTDMRAKNPKVMSLPQHFRGAGFTTAGVGKIYDPRCVDSKATCDAPSWSLPFVRPPHRGVLHGKVDQYALDPEVDADRLTDGAILGEAIKLIDQLAASADQEDQRFFLAVGFKKPHLPFVAPKEFWDLYDPSKLPVDVYDGGIVGDSGYVLHESSEFRGYEGVPQSGPIDEATARRAVHGYYACVSYVDSLIGRLIERLESRGCGKQTAIVLWGDHGFHLGDHGMWGKHSTLEMATRVPLIICPAGAGRPAVCNTPVESIDVFPTLCQLAQIDLPSEPLAGRSLVPIMTGQQDRVRDGAMTVFKNRGSLGYSYRTDRYRLTQWVNKNGRVVAEDLFDYQADPSETTNLAASASHDEVRQTLADQMLADGDGAQRLKMTQD